MSEDPKLIDFRFIDNIQNEATVIFRADGTIEIGERWRDQPEEAARLFLEHVKAQWPVYTTPDGWIGKPSGDAGPTVVVDNDFDRLGWEKVGHVFRAFRYLE